MSCVSDVYSMHKLIFSPADVAKWVLNRQIVRETDKIVYKYDLIDDFDRNRCTFSGPLGFLFRCFARSRRVMPQGSPRHPQGSSRRYLGSQGNVQFGIAEYQLVGDEHEYEQHLPSTYEPQNHMLRIMVSVWYDTHSMMPV